MHDPEVWPGRDADVPLREVYCGGRRSPFPAPDDIGGHGSTGGSNDDSISRDSQSVTHVQEGRSQLHPNWIGGPEYLRRTADGRAKGSLDIT